MSRESAPADPFDAPTDQGSAGSAPLDADTTEPTDLAPVPAAVYRLLAPAVATVGVELIDVDWNGGTLQVIIEHPEGVTIDRLAEVNRLVSPILDQHDPVPGRYTLEVSSPGVERPLRRLDHYRRAVGEDIIVKTIPEVQPRRLKGRLEAVADRTLSLLVVEIDGVDQAEAETRTVALDEVASARTVFDWGPTPKKGGGQKRSKGSGKKKAGGDRSKARKTSSSSTERSQQAKKKEGLR